MFVMECTWRKIVVFTAVRRLRRDVINAAAARRPQSRENADPARDMILFIALTLVTHAACHRVTESVEDVGPEAFPNTTTLYPVSNRTSSHDKDSSTLQTKEQTKISGDASAWKLDAAFAAADAGRTGDNGTDSAEVNKTSDAEKGFKPSPHLGSFLDESVDVTPTRATVADFRQLKRPPVDFLGFPEDHYKSSLYNDAFRHQNRFPYKMESSIFTKPKGNNIGSWQPTDQESRPTIEAPLNVPAGGLYRSPDAFKQKPAPTAADDDFGLDFNDLKENNNLEHKKRMNPWKSLLRLVTAFIPVGLIISALTPSVISVQTTATGPGNQYPQFRRSEPGLEQLAPISEPCRRRLLCELHSETNYTQSSQGGRRKGRQCHRIRCEDPVTLAAMLQWFLKHQPGPDRGHHFT